jgi:FtsP/CotA-like multicopper oxidase with cupredoxin domain
MSKHKILNLLLSTFMVASLLLGGSGQVLAKGPQPPGGNGLPHQKHGKITPADRQAAAANAAAAGLQVGVVAPATLAPTQGGVPDYFGPFPNWAYSPMPTFTYPVVPTPVGNSLVDRAYASDFPVAVGQLAPVFVVLPAALPAGTLTSFQTWNQATAGSSPFPSAGNIFNAYLLRPTGTPNQYQVVYASGTLTVPSLTTPGVSELASYLVSPGVAVNPGDVIAFYGQGIPVDVGGGTDILSYPAPAAPATNDTITLGVDPGFPIYSQNRTYSFGAVVDVTSATPVVSGGILKFTNTLPIPSFAQGSLCSNVGYSGTDADCFEIHLEEFPVQILPLPWPKTTIRGYVEYVNGVRQTPTYLGPIIQATRDRPVRIKFINQLPTGAGGDLFIPVDTTYMGAGLGPDPNTPPTATNADCQVINKPAYCYTDNRAVVHLHGGTTPWISDGTPLQWITPANENTAYPQGVSVKNVPDMNGCGAANDGCVTLYYTNQQSARLMFYHDHAYGITRLNVYAGEAAGYLLTDSTEQTLINGGTLNYQDANGNQQSVPVAANTLPGLGIPLIIQDKSFVDASTVLSTDPTWNSGTGTPDANGIRPPVTGDLWYPHVYMTNQNPYDISGANAMGRWDYGPWFWPPFTGLQYGAVPNPYCLPTPPTLGSTEANPGFYDCSATPWEPPFIPGTPNPSGTPESFMDTPIVNGVAYPTLNVPAGLVRFRILSVANDRYFNLSLWKADPTTVYPNGYSGPGNTEVKMVPFNSSQNAIAPFPTWWYDGSVPNPFDDRVGGVPDPATRGPAMIQIGTEGGFLPAPAVILNQPVNYVMNKRDITVGNIAPNQHSLLLGPAERADVLVDFSKFAGQTLIMYNDSPAPVPAADSRLDYFTGDPDQTSMGGAPTTLPGYGPNTRTVMKIVVGSGPDSSAPIDDVNQTVLSNLQTVLPAAFAASQETIIAPQAAYDAVYGVTTPDNASQFVKIQDTTHSFTPYGSGTSVLAQLQPLSLIEDFTSDYGRMNALIGNEIPNTNIQNQTSIPQGYRDPPVELLQVSNSKDVQVTPQGTLADGTQLWKFTHNGVDTHVIHVHMFTAQLVNRVGWDGAIRGPEPNELGFKDTFRMNPLEDIILAIRPIQLNLPFDVPNSIRPLDTTRPLGATNPAGMMGFTQVDPNGNPVNIVNELVNFGWEYVFHCHILGHEENDMMRPMVIAVPPKAPSNLTATQKGNSVTLSWTDSSVSETGWTVQRSADNLTWTSLAALNSTTMATTGSNVTYTDASYKSNGTPYYYRVLAFDTVGSTAASNFTASAGGTYPTLTASSAASNVIGPPAGSTSLAVSQAAAAKSPVVLNWTYSGTDQTGFTIQRATDAAFTTGLTVTNVAGNVFTYSDTKAKAGTLYYYRVIPTNFLGSGSPSNTVSINPHA